MTQDEVRAELVELQRMLGDLPSDAYDERISLKERQRELRAEARRTIDRQALTTELRGLVAEWERLAGRRIDVVGQAGDLSAGGNFGFTADAMKLNRAIDAGGGREELERRIRDLQRRLT